MKRKDFIKNTAALALGSAILPVLSKSHSENPSESHLSVVLTVLAGGLRIQDTLLNPENLPFVFNAADGINRTHNLFTNSNTNHVEGLSDIFFGEDKANSIYDDLSLYHNIQFNDIKSYGLSYLNNIVNKYSSKNEVLKIESAKAKHTFESNNSALVKSIIESNTLKSSRLTTIVLDGFDNCHNNHSQYINDLKEADQLISNLWDAMTVDLNLKNVVFVVTQDCGRDLSPNPDIYPNVGYNHNDENAKRTFCSLIYTENCKTSVDNISLNLKSNTDVKGAIISLFGKNA